jgi:hypothetical protein
MISQLFRILLKFVYVYQYRYFWDVDFCTDTIAGYHRSTQLLNRFDKIKQKDSAK